MYTRTRIRTCNTAHCAVLILVGPLLGGYPRTQEKSGLTLAGDPEADGPSSENTETPGIIVVCASVHTAACSNALHGRWSRDLAVSIRASRFCGRGWSEPRRAHIVHHLWKLSSLSLSLSLGRRTRYLFSRLFRFLFLLFCRFRKPLFSICVSKLFFVSGDSVVETGFLELMTSP